MLLGVVWVIFKLFAWKKFKWGLPELSSVVREAVARRCCKTLACPHWSWRRREHCLVLLWKLVNGIGPPALLNVLPATAASRSSSVLRSSHSLQFPLCLSSRRKLSLLCYTIPIWNKLSSSVISCSSVSSFQCSLRKAFAADPWQVCLWPYLSLVFFSFIVNCNVKINYVFFFLFFFFLSLVRSLSLCLLRRVPWSAPSYWTILIKQIVSIINNQGKRRLTGHIVQFFFFFFFFFFFLFCSAGGQRSQGSPKMLCPTAHPNKLQVTTANRFTKHTDLPSSKSTRSPAVCFFATTFRRHLTW